MCFCQKKFLCQGKRNKTYHRDFGRIRRGSQIKSLEVAPSGVRHVMFVAFMTCFKYSRGSLSDLEVKKITMGEMGNSQHGVINVTVDAIQTQSTHCRTTSRRGESIASQEVTEKWDGKTRTLLEPHYSRYKYRSRLRTPPTYWGLPTKDDTSFR
jgi:hypothetical protein